MNIIKTANWKAWIDKQPDKPAEAGTVRITGEAYTTGMLVKKNPQGSNAEVLLLEFTVLAMGSTIAQLQNIDYTEILTKEMQYTSVRMVCKGQVLANIELKAVG